MPLSVGSLQRLRGASSSLAGVGLGLWLVACGQEPRERPPYAEQSCEGEGCTPVGGPGGGVVPNLPASGETSSSDTQTSEQDTGADGGSRQLVIDPREATDLSNTSGTSLGSGYAVYLWPDETKPLLRSEGLAAETLTVTAGGQWLLVVVTDVFDDPDAAWLPTLSWQEPSMEPVVLPVFRTQFWGDMAASQANSPTSLDPNAAQVLLQVSDEEQVPRAGVSAEVSNGVIAYGAGGTALDVLAATDDSGLIVWMNARVETKATVTLVSDGGRRSVEVPTRASTLTIAGVQH
jgi:hypothetical protein